MRICPRCDGNGQVASTVEAFMAGKGQRCPDCQGRGELPGTEDDLCPYCELGEAGEEECTCED